MSTAIAIVLFVVGTAALVASILVDRPPARRRPPAAAPAEEPEPPPGASAPEHAPTRSENRATAAETRLARLRAELTGAPEPSEPAPAEDEGERTAPTPARPSGAWHAHAMPLVNHSDLVTHIRLEHPDLESDGSTIQMRRLHEVAHSA